MSSRLPIATALAFSLMGCTAMAGGYHGNLTFDDAHAGAGPDAYYTFCDHAPKNVVADICTAHKTTVSDYEVDDKGRVVMTKKLWDTLLEVNHKVNHEIHYLEEAGDTWTYAPKSGDCEDYALTKEVELIEQGGAAPGVSWLRFAAVRYKNEGHAVLLVNSDQGTFVLDNRTDKVLNYLGTPYQYVGVQIPGDYFWAKVK